MTSQCRSFLFISFLLLIMCFPFTLTETSRVILASVPNRKVLKATTPANATPFNELSSQQVTNEASSSNDFNTIKVSEIASTSPQIDHSAILSCKPKGPIRWSAPNPIHNNNVPIC